MDANLRRGTSEAHTVVSIHAPVMDAKQRKLQELLGERFNPRARDGREV